MPSPVDRRAATNPAQPRAEYFVDDVLRMASVPAEVILTQRPPAPQALMPPRTGYRRDPLTIRDVLDTDRFAPQFRSWVSGAPNMPPVDDDVHMSAGLRNSTTEGTRL